MNDHLAWNAKEKVTFLLAVVPYVLEHGPTPVEELASEFKIPADQVRRLATFIGTAGIPGESLAGLDNDLFDIDWDALLEDDVLEITRTIAVDDTPRFSGNEAAAILAGLTHLRAIFTEHDTTLAELATRAAQKISASTNSSRPEVSVEEESPVVPATFWSVNAALDQGQTLGFEYEDRRGTRSSRRVYPRQLIQGTDTWYLRAFCQDRQDDRLFRLDSMTEVVVLDGDPNASTNVGPYEAEVENVPETQAEVLVYPEVRYLLDRWNPMNEVTEDDGRLRLTITLVHPERAIDLVCVAPTGIEIVAPRELRTLVRDWADALIERDQAPATMIE